MYVGNVGKLAQCGNLTTLAHWTCCTYANILKHNYKYQIIYNIQGRQSGLKLVVQNGAGNFGVLLIPKLGPDFQGGADRNPRLSRHIWAQTNSWGWN